MSFSIIDEIKNSRMDDASWKGFCDSADDALKPLGTKASDICIVGIVICPSICLLTLTILSFILSDSIALSATLLVLDLVSGVFVKHALNKISTCHKREQIAAINAVNHLCHRQNGIFNNEILFQSMQTNEGFYFIKGEYILVLRITLNIKYTASFSYHNLVCCQSARCI
jgi:hypothetical protein